MSARSNVSILPTTKCPECQHAPFRNRCLACGFEQNPEAITPGIYSAQYETHGHELKFGVWRLWIDAYLPDLGVTLRRWYQLADCSNGRMLAGTRSDVVRELTAILNWRVGPHIDDEILAGLKQLELRAEVARVVIDRNGCSLHELSQYSKIARLFRSR